jgi:hypothetical protein
MKIILNINTHEFFCMREWLQFTILPYLGFLIHSPMPEHLCHSYDDSLQKYYTTKTHLFFRPTELSSNPSNFIYYFLWQIWSNNFGWYRTYANVSQTCAYFLCYKRSQRPALFGMVLLILSYCRVKIDFCLGQIFDGGLKL